MLTPAADVYVEVNICICTFRRDSLSATLKSIAQQRVDLGVELRVIVADNDERPDKRAAIEQLARNLALDLKYVHAPSRNISIARNACLEEATGEVIAFIDDDEVASPDWIAALLARRGGHDIVFGVSQARYSDTRIPHWARAGDFHSNRLGPRDAEWNGYTANVLIDIDLVRRNGLRFATELGQVGGEDTLFFLEAFQKGARFGYAPAAIVDEETPAVRATLKWLLLRRFRAGQIHHIVLMRQKSAARGVVLAVPKFAMSIAMSLLNVWSPSRVVANLLRAALHAGVIAAAGGIPLYREYGPPG